MLLDQAERQLPSLVSAELGAYLVQLDTIDQLWTELAADGADLRAEAVRWQDLQQRIATRAGQLVKLANQAGGMAALRAANPPATNPWWQLDARVAEQRRRSIRQLGITVGVIAVILLAGAWIYSTFLAPSPEVLAVVEATNRVEGLVAEQKWAEALAVAEQALVAAPGDPDLLVWAGVLADRLGATEQAAAYLAQAEKAIGDPLRYQNILAMQRFRVADLTGAEAAAQGALALDPNNAQAYFLLANLAEARGDAQGAIALFEKTAALADNTDPQLTVISKMRMGMLLQSMAIMPSGTPDGAPDGAAELQATTPLSP